MIRIASLVALLALGGLVLAFGLTSIAPPGGHCDFTLRMNELACVRQGVNPFDVWHGDVALKPFYPNTWKGEPPEGCTEMVNAYAPWEYAYMYPLSLLGGNAAWFVYCFLMLVAFGVVGWFGWRTGKFLSDDSDVAVLVMAVPLLAVSYVLWSNWAVGNFMVFVLAASALMIVCLEGGRDCLAGVCWAIAMVKPQIGLVFAVPLLLFGKWRTCLVAVGICLVLTGVMSVVLRTDVVDLLLQGPAANTSFFHGCGTWPACVCGMFGSVDHDIIIAAVLGVLVCLAMTWSIRHEKNWVVRFFPAALCSCCWTYTQSYSHAMGYYLVLVLIMGLVARPRSRILWVLLVLSLLIVPRFYLAWHGALAYFGMQFPFGDYVHRCVDSLNSSLTLTLGVIFCLVAHRNAQRGVL